MQDTLKSGDAEDGIRRHIISSIDISYRPSSSASNVREMFRRQAERLNSPHSKCNLHTPQQQAMLAAEQSLPQKPLLLHNARTTMVVCP